MTPLKETKNENYIKPEIQDIASLSDGLVLHGESGEGGPGEDEGGQDDPNF